MKAQTMPRRCADCIAEHVCTTKIDSVECRQFYKELRVVLADVYKKGKSGK